METAHRADPEVAWIKRAQRGDREAFELLVDRYQRRILALTSRMVRRRDDVEDLAQEIFVKVYLAIRKYNFEASFATWLTRVAVNHCYDYLRRERVSRVNTYAEMSEERERAIEALAEDSETGGARVEQRIAARDLVEKLLRRASPDDRVILSLKEIEEFSVEEIGETLKLKPSTVKVRLHRARRRMLDDLRRLRQENK